MNRPLPANNTTRSLPSPSPAGRVLCAWLPNWPIQRWIVDRPEHSFQTTLLYALDARRGQRIAACSSAAAQAGVRVGMSLAEARGLAAVRSRSGDPSLNVCIEEHDPVADRRRLEKLAHACDRFSPIVGLQPSDPPGGLVLDVTGLSRLFDGEEKLAEEVVEAFRRWGYIVRVAVADTQGIAWAWSQHAPANWRSRSRRTSISSPQTRTTHTSPPADQPLAPDASLETTAGQIDTAQPNTAQPNTAQSNTAQSNTAQPNTGQDPDNSACQRLPWEDPQRSRVSIAGSFEPHVVPPGSWGGSEQFPVDALRISADAIQTLHHLGISRLAQLFALPREALAARFEPEVLNRMDQWRGDLAEPIAAWKAPTPFRSTCQLEYPTADVETIEELVRRQIVAICNQMQNERQGAVRLECNLRCEDRRSMIFRVGLFEPTAGAAHLLGLVRMQLEQSEVHCPVVAIEVHVPLSAPLCPRQYELFDEGRATCHREQAALLNRLSSRLGREQVVQVESQPGAQPEHAYRYVPVTGRKPTVARSSQKRSRKRRCIDLRGDGIVLPGGTRPESPAEHGELFWVGRSSSAKARQFDDENTLSMHDGKRPLDRPIEILPRPILLEKVTRCRRGTPIKFAWGRKAFRAVRSDGPERIETGWWRGPSARRDYYRVETETGQRFWIFLDRRGRQWYLHGIFA